MIWQERLDALRAIIREQVGGLQANEARRSTIESVLLCLEAFTGRMFKFFADGFTATTNHYTLASSLDEPPECVYGRIIEQGLFDLEALMDAHRQRKASYQQHDIKGEIRDALSFADRLAFDALQPAVQAGYINPCTVLTYYQKALRISLMPYARVALIGIPLSAIRHPHDYLAIPHEVGHYIYRNTVLCSTGHRFLEEFRQNNQNAWWLPWLEEIFADVYGCVIAGPAIALDFQERAMQELGADFIESQPGDPHPTPLLRPSIYLATLQLLAKNWTMAENLSEPLRLLRNNWQQHLQSRYAYLKERYPYLEAVAPENLEQFITIPLPNRPDQTKLVLKAVDEIRDGVIKPLLEFAQINLQGLGSATNPFGTWGGPSDWQQALRMVDGRLKSEFIPEKYQGHEPTLPEVEMQDEAGQKIVSLSSKAPLLEKLKIGETGANPFETQMQQIVAPGQKVVALTEWRELLRFGGWTTEGPGSPRGQGGQ